MTEGFAGEKILVDGTDKNTTKKEFHSLLC